MMIGKNTKKVMIKPAITGVVRIWIRSSRGPSVGIVDLWDEVDEAREEVEVDEAAEEEECDGKGRSWRFAWVEAE